MRKISVSFVLCMTTFVSIYAAPNPSRRQMAENYISLYRYIAVMESLRTGIPASIKLAQGLHESNFGQGSLAVKSNNHFGIKWRGIADGSYVEAFDDEKDKNGKRKASKFIKFNTPEDSYLYHSELLTTRSIYRSLFIYDRADYRSWAKGLKKAGYATDPQYAEKIIGLIEQYNLAQFDIPSQLSLEEDTPQSNSTDFEETVTTVESRQEAIMQPFPTKKSNKNTVTKVNKATLTQQGNSKKNENKEEEEHILFEVTSPELASKNGSTVKNPIPKRQKK